MKEICSRLTEAIEEISSIYSQDDRPIEITSDRLLEGVGLYFFVEEQEPVIKEKYPAFTDLEVLNIVVGQWERLPQEEKNKYSSRIEPEQLKRPKKLKNINKMV